MISNRSPFFPSLSDWGASKRGADNGSTAILQSGLASKLQLLRRDCEIRSTDYLPPFASDRRSLDRMKHWGRVLTMSEAVSKEMALIASNDTFSNSAWRRPQYSYRYDCRVNAAQTASRRDLGRCSCRYQYTSNFPSGNIHGMALAVSLGLGDTRSPQSAVKNQSCSQSGLSLSVYDHLTKARNRSYRSHPNHLFHDA